MPEPRGQYNATRQFFGRIYGTYTTPGPSYNVTRNYVSYIRLALQSGDQTHARIDTSIPLRNSPELLANYWRTDFDRDPTTTNSNGDTVSDWAVTGGGTFDTTKLASGIWTATGAIETRPLSDFTTTTTVEARCRNTSVGGNGAVVAIYADRQRRQLRANPGLRAEAIRRHANADALRPNIRHRHQTTV